MTHILKYEEWETPAGWLCGDVSALAAGSNNWWYVPILLNMSPVDYVKLLINKFKVKTIHYKANKNVLIFYFSTLEDCRKFKNYINKEARNKKFYIY